MMNNQFKELLKQKAKVFLSKLDKVKTVRLFSHHDADGLSSASLMTSFLKSKDKQFHLTVLPQLEQRNINQLNGEGLLILCDLGSGQLSDLKEVIESRPVLIIDHHQLKDKPYEHDNLIHVNPCLAGINGSNEVSAAGVCYLFLKQTGFKPDAVLALIGASGDYQDLDGFQGVNQEILDECGKVVERKDLRLYGANTRPVHKALEYSSIIIPGVSGSGSGSINFLNELNIPLKKGDDWRTLSDLNSDEKKKLVSEIIVKRGGEEKPDDVFASVYEIVGESGFRKTLKEFSSLLNACGRLEQPSIGIALLANRDYDELAVQISSDYKNSIAQALNWFEDNKEKCVKTEKVFYLNSGEGIKPNIIGTICSILSKSFLINNELILGLAVDGELVKVSARKTGDSDINVGSSLNKAAEGIGEGGGHKDAGGAYIKRGMEEKFINAFEKVLKD